MTLVTVWNDPNKLSEAHLHFEQHLKQLVSQNDLEQVKQLVSQAEPFISQNPYLHQWYLYTLSYLAGRDGQKLDEATHHFEWLHRQENLAPRLRGRVLNALGIVYEMNEQWDRALRFYHECVGFYEAEQNDLKLGRTLNNLAIVHWKGLDYVAATNCTQRSINILSQIKQDDPDNIEALISLGVAWNTFGFSQMKQGKLLEANAAFEQSQTICAECDNLYHEGIATNNLAQVYRRLGETEKAEEFYLRARQLTFESDNQREMAEAVYGMGLLKMQTRSRSQEVQALFDEALDLAQSSNNHEIITDIFLSRAELQEEKGNLDQALDETQYAVETVESLRANIMLPDDRVRMMASRVEAYEQMVSRLCQVGTAASYAEAFRHAEMSKSRTLIEMLAGRPLRAPERVPAKWLEEEAQLRKLLHELYQDAEAPREEITLREAQLNQLREHIRLLDAEFESFQTVEPLPLHEVQARLPADGVLVEYFTIGDQIMAFVVTPETFQVRRLRLQVKQLRRAFRRVGDDKYGQLHHLTRAVDNRLHSPWILRNLYQALIKPLGEEVESARILCIVPHGLLHYVPFHALYQEESGKGNPTCRGNPSRLPSRLPNSERLSYLSEASDGAGLRRIIYAPSATALFDYCQQKPLSQQVGCLALGYDNETLTQAEAEAQAIVRLMGGKALNGAAATRDRLMSEAKAYRYLHISCHGSFSRSWPMASSLTLADETVQVADILRELQLNAELVCLSACETGRSHILRGDELIGLSRAFLYAGTPAIIVSHWVVDELSTSLMMERFYEELGICEARGMIAPNAEALSRAQHYLRTLTLAELRQTLHMNGGITAKIEEQLDYLAHSGGFAPLKTLNGDACLFAHPYYWAGFFLVGDRL